MTTRPMRERLWEVLVFCLMALVLFVCTLVVVKWTIAFVDWSTIDSGWAQAAGSVAALGVAIFVMSRQNKHAAKLIADADRLSTLRRAHSVDAIMKRSYRRIAAISAGTATRAASPSELTALKVDLEISKEILVAMHKSTGEIPAYDLGSFDMADAVLQFAENVGEFIVVIDHLLVAPDMCGGGWHKGGGRSYSKGLRRRDVQI